MPNTHQANNNGVLRPSWAYNPWARVRTGPTRTRIRAGVAVSLVVTGLSAACTNGPPSSVPLSRASPSPPGVPPSGPPTVSVVPQAGGSRAGPVVAVEGIVWWVVPGHPECAELDTSHQPPQILSLVGSTADRLRRAAEIGRHSATEHARITGSVPPSAATVCPGLTFTVTQVTDDRLPDSS